MKSSRIPTLAPLCLWALLLSSVAPSTIATAVHPASAPSLWGKVRIRGGAASAGALTAEPDLVEPQVHAESAEMAYLEERLVKSMWDLHRRWAKVAAKRRNHLYWARSSALAFAVTGAMMPAIQQLPAIKQSNTRVKIIGLIGGGSLAIASLLKKQFFKDEDVIRMIKTSWTSQAIEAEVFKYRAQAMEYHSRLFKTKQAALQLLRERCNQISLEGRETDSSFDYTSPDDRPPPPALTTVSEYFQRRIDHQINGWYKKQSHMYKQRSVILGRIEAVLLSGAAIANVGATVDKEFLSFLPLAATKLVTGSAGWVGACTTAAAAIGAHLAAQNYCKIAHEYNTAVLELENIKDGWPAKATTSGSNAWDEFVAKSEGVIESTTERWARTKSGKDDLTFENA